MDYKNMSKEELIEYIKKLNEDQTGKYGLIWDKEKEPEEIVVNCDKYIPILKKQNKKDVVTSGFNNNNILIEGDNFHALSVLNYTHKEAIDVIYIDPPYNTKNEGFTYNDKLINSEDGYRHSKWLNMMQKRLKLAKELLKEDGVIFISIDDNEYAQLKLLCDSIFGENNFVENFVWNKTQTPPSLSYKSRNNIDYILCYEKNRNSKKYFGKGSSNSDAPLLNKGNGYKELTFPIRSIKFNIPDGVYEKGKYYNIDINEAFEVKKGINITKVKMSGEFKWGQANLEREINNGTILLIKSKKMSIRYQKSNDRVTNMLPNKLIDSSFDVGTNEDASKHLKYLDLNFTFPKPVSLIEFLINMVTYDKKEFTILDYYAGSGTAGEAILRINKEQNKNAKFILITNNENNICEEVTYPRLFRSINGYKELAPLGGNLKYFKTDFVDNAGTRDQLYYDLTEKCIPMLCLKEDTFNQLELNEEYAIFTNEETNKYTCVYFDIFGNKYNEFIDKLEEIGQQKSLYIFALGDYVNTDDLKEVKNYTIEAIPYRILDLYKKVIKMSKED